MKRKFHTFYCCLKQGKSNLTKKKRQKNNLLEPVPTHRSSTVFVKERTYYAMQMHITSTSKLIHLYVLIMMWWIEPLICLNQVACLVCTRTLSFEEMACLQTKTTSFTSVVWCVEGSCSCLVCIVYGEMRSVVKRKRVTN